jgi:hypothetical protein
MLTRNNLFSMDEGKEGRFTPPQEITQGLPVVTRESIDSIKQMYGEKWGEHLEEVKARMVKENPVLVEFINNQVGKYPPQLHNPMFEVIVGTIAVLEHQARANKMGPNLIPYDPKKLH